VQAGVSALGRALSWVFLTAVLAALAFVATPLPARLLDRAPGVSTRIEDRGGELLHELRSRADGRSVPLPGEVVPPLVQEAFVAAEDQRFFQHGGVDPRAIARAVVQDVAQRRLVSGASTLNMQLARILVPRPRSLLGKVQEALWAIRLTVHLGRARVLTEYLNRVALGNSLYGVEAASRFYFDRPAATLSAGQAAMLAGLARSPESGDPLKHPTMAEARMDQVLERMFALGFLDKEGLRVALAAPVDLWPRKGALRAPHLVMAIAGHLNELGLEGATRIETTLDAQLQQDAEELVRREVHGLTTKWATQAAALVIDNATGEVLAEVGSANYFDAAHEGFNDGTRAHRQPGSALKPFAYGLALASGHTAAEVLSDVETHLATPTGDYAPRNYDRRVHGPVRLRAALANSYNVPAVRLAETLGPDHVLELLRQAGFESLTESADHYGAGIVLGDGDVTLHELGRAFRGLARGGVLEDLREVHAAFDAQGQRLLGPAPLAPRRFLAADAVALLTDIISDEAARAPAFGLDNALRLPFPVAAKTGTSRAYVDNWCVGFTKERTVAVWVGNFDGTPMRHVSGITGAGPLFKALMIRSMRGLTPAPLVNRARFDQVDICPLSGKRAGPGCDGALKEIFLPGTAPTESCPMHLLVSRADCHGPDCEKRRVLDVGPEFYNWAQGEGLSAAAPVGMRRAEGEAPRLLLPGDGDEYLLEPGIPGESQTIPVRVRASDPGLYFVQTDEGERLPLDEGLATRVQARAGAHRVELWAKDGHAPVAVARFVVR
jgi:penicillin-binding protein 1C